MARSLPNLTERPDASRKDVLVRMRPWFLAACAISMTFVLLLGIDNPPVDSVDRFAKILLTVVVAVGLFAGGFGLAQDLERRRGAPPDDSH